MNAVFEVINRRKALLLFRRDAMDDHTLDDLAAHAAVVDEMEVLRDIAAAYAAEVASQWSLPRAALKAELHEAMAAVERDDLVGLTGALSRVTDLIVGDP